MDRSISVRTPESIAFSYELAGLGSRFLAVIVDLAIQVLLFAAIVWGIVLIGSHAPKGSAPASGSAAASVGVAIVVTIIFLIFFGYFIAFEALWNGQTPGKKLLGIRVVRDGGYPLDAAASFIRNLIRTGEFALGFYAVSAAACLLSPENKRLGDIAAGTIVVRDSRTHSLAAILENAHEQRHRIPLIADAEYALVARFLVRRREMAPQYRRTLAFQIAERLRPRLSTDLRRLDDEELLERIDATG